MVRIAFISVCDRNAQGQRLMSARLKQHGHECRIIFLKRYPAGRQTAPALEADPLSWVGIDRLGRPFQHAAPAPECASRAVHPDLLFRSLDLGRL
jgi:hypothetical protein